MNTCKLVTTGTSAKQLRNGKIRVDVFTPTLVLKCVVQCPQSALELVTLLIDLEDKMVAAVTEQHRRKIKYTCSPCKPESGKAPCVLACMENAIRCVWNPRWNSVLLCLLTRFWKVYITLGACFRGDFSRFAFFVSVFVLNKKARKMEKIKK